MVVTQLFAKDLDWKKNYFLYLIKSKLSEKNL